MYTYISLLATLSLSRLVLASEAPLGGRLGSSSSQIAEKDALLQQTPSLKSHIHNSESDDRDSQHSHSSSTQTPWTESVKCMPDDNLTETFCVYSNAGFANGKGISFLTTPSIAEKIITLPAFMDPKTRLYEKVIKPDDTPWEIRVTPEKGRGLYATHELHRGDKIMADTPVGVYHLDALARDGDLDYAYLQSAVSQLPEPSQKLFKDNAPSTTVEHPLMGRVSANAFAVDFQGASHFLHYPETSLFNHDCRPNAMYYYNPNTLIHSTEAGRTIEAGEEITVPYTNILAPRAERQRILSTNWGFECTCSLCSGTAQEVHASDLRLKRIVALQLLLSEWSPWSDATPAMAEELIRLYARENLHAAKAPGHTLAAQSYNAVGDTRMAKFHAEYALEAGLITVGGDDGADSMQKLLDNPEAHWSFNVRKRKTEL